MAKEKSYGDVRPMIFCGAFEKKEVAGCLKIVPCDIRVLSTNYALNKILHIGRYLRGLQ